MYPQEIVIPMKEELTENGFVEMLTAADVDTRLADKGTTLVGYKILYVAAAPERPGPVF